MLPVQERCQLAIERHSRNKRHNLIGSLAHEKHHVGYEDPIPRNILEKILQSREEVWDFKQQGVCKLLRSRRPT